MKNPTMLYRCPGPEVFEGVSCETTIVDAEDVEAAKADGWCADWMQAAAAKLAANEQEQAEIAQKLDKAAICAALDAAGVQYDKRLGADKLAALLPK